MTFHLTFVAPSEVIELEQKRVKEHTDDGPTQGPRREVPMARVVTEARAVITGRQWLVTLGVVMGVLLRHPNVEDAAALDKLS